MEENASFEDEMVNWFLTTTDKEVRRGVLYRIFNVLPTDEFKQCFSIISKCKKYRNKVTAESKEKAVQQQEQPAERTGSEQVNLSAPFPLAATGWLKNWKKSDVVSVDVEKVLIPLKETIKRKGKLIKYVEKAGLISVKDSNYVEIFRSKIRRARGSYHVTPASIAINGIRETTLQEDDAENAEEVYKRLRQLLTGKLVVKVALEKDFDSFDGLPAGLFDTFDLQSHYYRLSYSTKNKPIVERIALRTLCSHYFGVDMQIDGQPHDPEVDAEWTMRIFLDVYCNIEPPPESKDGNYSETNEIDK